MSDERLRELLEVQAYFRLPSVGLVEKDLHVVRAIAALAAIDAAPFASRFRWRHRACPRAQAGAADVGGRGFQDRAGGRRRRSAAAPFAGRLGGLRDRVTPALQAAGFAFDPADKSMTWSRNENRYTVYQLPYDADRAGQGRGFARRSRSS